MRSTHQIPIFRFRDGFEAMRSNEKSIEEANRALLANKAIIMFVEGSTQSTRKLRTFQKGLSRMTKDFELAHPEGNLGILPVTINFSEPNRVSSSVTVSIFDVVEPKDYNFSTDTSNKPLIQLTKDLHATMKEDVFHLDEKTNEDIFNKVIAKMPHKLFPNFFPKVVSNPELLNRGKALANAFNSNADMTDFKVVADAKAEFLGEVNYSGFDKLLYFLLSPLALIGYISNLIPLKSAHNFAKAKVKKPIFFTSVLIALCVGAYFLYVISIVIVSLLFKFPFYYALLIFAFVSFCYVYFLHLKKKKKASEDYLGMSEELKSSYLNIEKIMADGNT